jgi:transcriptional regulator with XRE-family HTH domain
MAKKRLTFSDELRRAVDSSGLSRYRIAKRLNVSESLLSRFMSGRWRGQETVDALAELLDLHVAAGRRPEEEG